MTTPIQQMITIVQMEIDHLESIKLTPQGEGSLYAHKAILECLKLRLAAEMKWVRASDRLPQVAAGTSKSFFIKMINDQKKKVIFYGISGKSLLNVHPDNIEWLDDVDEYPSKP